MADPLDFETAADVVAQDNDRIASDAASLADPFDKAADMVASEQQVRLASAVKAGGNANADSRARAIALADQTRLPVDVVERNLDTVARKVRNSSVDLEQLAQHHPAVAEWLSDPNNAAVSNDDLGGIRRVDAAVRALTGQDPSGVLPPGYLFSAGKIMRPIGDGSLADTWDTLDDLAKDLDAQGDRDLAVEIQRKSNAEAFEQEWGWAQHVMAGAGQSLQASQRAMGTRTEYDHVGDEVIEASHVNAPGWFGDVQRGIGGLIADVPLMMLGGPVAKGAVALAHLSRARAAVSTVVGRATATRLGKAGTVAASVQPLAIREGITETQDHGAVDGALAWMVETVVPGAFGRTGVERAILGSGGAPIADGWRGVLKRLISDAGLEAGEEAVTEFAHAVRENATGADPHALDPDNLWRRLSVAATVGGVAGGGFSLPGTIAEKFARDGEEAHRATTHADKLTNAIETLAASKTNARAGDRVLDLMEKSLGQSDRFSFVDAEDFRGAFDDPAAAAAALGVSKEYAEALATGGQLQIPTTKLLQRASTDESTAKLVPKVRRSPVSRNAAEAARFVDQAPEEVKRLQSQARASAEAVKAAGASPDAELQGVIEERLVAAGQEATTARTNAQVMARTFTALGKRSGKDPAELYRTYLDGRITKVLPKLMRGEKFDLVDAMLERIRTGEVPSDKDINGPSVVDFLRDKGLRDLAFNGELVQLRESDGSRLPGEKSLIRDDGITLDEAAQLAAEAGYIKERDIPALLRALDDELRGGSPAYIEGNGDPNARSIRESLDQMERALREAGVDVFSATNKQAREALAKMMEQEEGKTLEQGAAVVDAPRSGRLDLDALLRQWRKATGDKTPIGGEAAFLALAEESDAVDAERGKSYQQPKKKGSRGSLVFGKGRNFTIRLFQSENLSTFLHEGGHLFLEVMGDLATAEGAAPDLVADYQAMRDWFGKNAADIRSQAIDLATDNGAAADVLYKLRAASDADITAIAQAFRSMPKDGTAAGYLHEAMHEYFARGFEAYLMEGKAPVPSLRSVFARIKGWMVAIYNTVKTLRVQLSPEMVDVFDRLVASEDEVDAAEARAGTTDILPPELFKDPAAFDEYRLAVQANQSAARDRLARELIGDYRKELAIAWREQRDEIRADVAREVDGRPVFQIISALQRGQLPDGSRLPDEYQGMKLDKGELVTEWGEAVLKKLPGPANVSDNAANRGAFVYADSGLGVEMVAKAWKFPDGSTMIEAMIAAPDRDSLIETTVAAKMRELHPDPLIDGSLVDRADRAIAGDLRGELLAREMRALGSRTGQTPAPIEVLRHVARETIDRQKARDLTPDKYRVAAATSARRATEAAGKQDWSTAYIEKQREALNLEMYRAARDAVQAGEKGRAYLRTFDTLSGRQRVGKAGGGEFVVYDERGEVLDAFRRVEDAQALVEQGTGRSYTQTNGYLEQIDQILEGFNLRRPSNRSLRKRESLRKWIDRKQKEGEPVDIDPQVVDDLGKRNWNDLTVSEQGAAVDAVKNIAHIVQLKNRLLRDAKAKTFDEARGAIVENIVRHQPVSRPDQITDDLPHRVGDAIKWYFDAHRKDSFLAHKMDGYKAGGTVWEYFIRPRNEAATEQETRNAKAAMEFSALFKEWGKSPGAIARSIPGTNLKLTLQERIGLALNWGNAEGRQRVLMYLNRHGKTANDAQAVLDSLDAADWKLINGMVRQINSHWSDVAALERRVTGLAPEKVQAVPFVTKAGVQPGGYYPIKYNARKSNKAGDLNAATDAKQMAAAAGGHAQTRRGHTKIRAENVDGLALRLDFGVAGEHLAEVIHDITHREMLIDQNKLLRDKSISLTIKDHHGRNALDQFVNTAADIATGDKPGRAAAERLLRFLRINGSAATFGFNLTSALMNLTGFSQSLVRVGPGHMASAVARVTRDAAHMESAAAWVEGKSRFMANRAHTFLREVADAARRIEPGGGMANVRHWGYWPMTQVQRAVDTITWVAAYDKALADAQKAGEQLAAADTLAVAIADQTVIDTQGSGRVGDLSAMQRGGEAAKLLTAFYSYFSVSANLQGAAIGRLWNDPKDPKNWLRLGTTTLLVWTLPAVMGGMIRSFLQGDDRDEDKRWEHLAREQAGFGAGMLVGLRETSGSIEGGFGYSGPAGARGLGNLANLAGQVADLDADAGMIKAAIGMGGTLTGLPSTQANRLLDAVMQFEKDGDTWAATRRALFGAPRRE